MPGGHQQRRPEHGVELQDVLAEDVVAGGPEALGQVVAVAGERWSSNLIRCTNFHFQSGVSSIPGSRDLKSAFFRLASFGAGCLIAAGDILRFFWRYISSLKYFLCLFFFTDKLVFKVTPRVVTANQRAIDVHTRRLSELPLKTPLTQISLSFPGIQNGNEPKKWVCKLPVQIGFDGFLMFFGPNSRLSIRRVVIYLKLDLVGVMISAI